MFKSPLKWIIRKEMGNKKYQAKIEGPFMKFLYLAGCGGACP